MTVLSAFHCHVNAGFCWGPKGPWLKNDPGMEQSILTVLK